MKAIRGTAASLFSRIEMRSANEAVAAHQVTQLYGASAAQRSLKRAAGLEDRGYTRRCAALKSEVGSEVAATAI